MKQLWLVLVIVFLAACGKGHSSNGTPFKDNNPLNPETTSPQTNEKPAPTQPTTTETDTSSSPSESPSESPDSTVVINQADLAVMEDLLPTMYFTAIESEISCKGKYGRSGPVYTGKEKTRLLEMNGTYIATVCTRFSKVLAMEGSAILSDRGFGKFAVNYSGKVGGATRFHKLGKCVYGEGVQRDLCLLPYHTLATDNKVHKVGEIIFIPKAVGLVLPDGTKHEGFFIVRDTGGAFKGIGPKRVDMFTGTDHDNDNVFQQAGFHHKSPMEAYKISGETAELIKARLKAKFPELY